MGGRAGAPGLGPKVGADTVVTYSTVRESELEVVEPVHILHERLVAKSPREGGCREVSPAVFGRELAGTVCTHRKGEQIAVEKSVVYSTEVRKNP